MSWKWDDDQQAHIWCDPEGKCWIYTGGRTEEIDHRSLHQNTRLPSSYQTVQDDELSNSRMFDYVPSSLHYINIGTGKEHISLLACQHFLRPCSERCPEPWTHTHPFDGWNHPSMAVYIEEDREDQTLVIDLKGNYMDTVSTSYDGQKPTAEYRCSTR
jgi:hypothetical protein